MIRAFIILNLALAAFAPLHAGTPTPATTAEVLANAPADAWRSPDPARTLSMELPAGRVVIALARDFAPAHARHIRTLAHTGYWDGLSMLGAPAQYERKWAGHS